jgi:hypothetical protein
MSAGATAVAKSVRFLYNFIKWKWTRIFAEAGELDTACRHHIAREEVL